MQGDIKKQYTRYLELKKGKQFKYDKFRLLIKDKSFEEILEIKHPRELGISNSSLGIKEEYIRYLELKKGTPFGYNRFWNLRLDYSFEEVLLIKHRNDTKIFSSGRLGFRKYSEQFIKRIVGCYNQGLNIREVAEVNGITFGTARNLVYNNRKLQKL